MCKMNEFPAPWESLSVAKERREKEVPPGTRQKSDGRDSSAPDQDPLPSKEEKASLANATENPKRVPGKVALRTGSLELRQGRR